PLDARITPALGDDLLAVLREALTNVVRHAGARSVDVEIALDRGLTVRVADDGAGIDPGDRRSRLGHGLRNLDVRARARGGTFVVRPGVVRGTALEWRVPFPVG